MKKTALGIILLISSAATMSGNDVWQTLFKEKLQEARQGNSHAQFDVGSMYQNGRGVSPDRNEASTWYRKAAEMKLAEAMKRLEELGVNAE